MARFAALITVALLIAACGNAVSDKAQETMANYTAAQETAIRAAR